MPTYQCIECGTHKDVIPARLKTAKFCTMACRSKWRAKNFTGENNPNYRGGKIAKTCKQCGVGFEVIPANEHRQFCSKPCADIGGFRYSGKDHPNYKEDALPRNRPPQKRWAQAVISRDKATCQHCGAQGVELHAHHILSYRDHPELRDVVSNGVTLCHSCHWKVHSVQNEKAVNSVKPLTAWTAEGNTEPSFRGNLVEGVTTRGQAYRRWNGPCDWCGVELSKRLSDATGRAHNFCSKHCSGKYNSAHRTYRTWRNPVMPTAVISSTSAAPEREEIV